MDILASNASDGKLFPPLEECLSYEQVAQFLSVPITKIIHLVKNHQILAIKHDKQWYIPKLFLSQDKHEVNKHISGLIAVLSDGGFNDIEIMQWLFTPQDDLIAGSSICPAEGLHTHQAREVMRRAQSLAL